MTDDLTHIITITVTGNYHNGKKDNAIITMHGDGDLTHMLDSFRTALVAAGFHPDTASRLGLTDG